jgi:hypothetical protein
LEYWDPEKLVDNPRNWRTHPPVQAEGLDAVLDEVGWAGAALYNEETGRLIDGHLRKKRALARGEQVPVIVGAWTEEQEALILATLDPLAGMAEVAGRELAALLEEVQDYAPDGASPILERLREEAEEALDSSEDGEDDQEEVNEQIENAEVLREKWQVELGQVWEIPSRAGSGVHRIVCGDSTDSSIVKRLMGERSAALLLTDPPYNVGMSYGTQVNDSKPREVYRDFTQNWFPLWRSVSEKQIVTPGCNNMASWLRWYEPYHVAPWTKTNSMTNGKVSRFWCWEPTLFYGEPDEWSWEGIIFIGEGWSRKRANDVFNYPVGAQGGVEGHPCPKPLGMWGDLIESYTEPGALVVDAFVGSGTTPLGAEIKGRLGWGSEIEPKWVAVTLERLSIFGLEPRRVE